MPDGQNISSDPLIVSCDARGVAELRLNQPGKHNALSAQLIEALTEAAADMGERGDVRRCRNQRQRQELFGWRRPRLDACAASGRQTHPDCGGDPARADVSSNQ